MQITEADRIAARAEREIKRRMSAKAASRLRKMAENRLRQEAASQRFIADFARLRKDDWTLRRLLERISRPVKERQMSPDEVNRYFCRRSLKLRRCLANGWEPQSVQDVQFFAELTLAEQALSDDAFFQLFTKDWPNVQGAAPIDAVKVSRRQMGRTCVQCGKKFLANRADAEHCSSGCRNKASYGRGHRGNPRGPSQIPDLSAVIDTLSQKSTLEPALLQPHTDTVSSM